MHSAIRTMNSKLSEQALMQLRDLLVGPAQREAEERFSQLLEILEEQENANRGRIQTLESDLHELSAEASGLRQDYEALGQRIERVLQAAEQEKATVQAQFGEAARMLQAEFESKVHSLSKTVQETLRRADAEAERAINALVRDVHAMRKETHELLERAETHSMSTLEDRIAKWRSEIEASAREGHGKRRCLAGGFGRTPAVEPALRPLAAAQPLFLHTGIGVSRYRRTTPCSALVSPSGIEPETL